MLDKKGLIDMIDNLRKEHNVPAVQVGIIKDKEIIFCGGTGFRDFEKKIEADAETIFAIGSATKAFTAESIAILVDEGKVEWDKPVKHYIPEFEMYNNYVTENITVRDILCHRCGLPRHDLMWYLNMEGYSTVDIIRRLKYLKPNAPFRYKMQYQNHMYALAGYLIERVTGQKWDEFVRERILEPLGMVNTNFSVEDSKKVENKALPYKFDKGIIKEIPFKNIDPVGSAGSINSNIKDMLKWVQFNLDKGQWNGKKIISKENIEECHTPQMIIRDMFPWKFEEIDFQNYGMGWFIESYRGHKVIHHGGAIDGFMSMVSFIPEKNAGFVILTNGNGNRIPTILQYSLYDILLGCDKIEWDKRFRKEIEKAEIEYKESKNKIRSSAPKNTKPSFELQAYSGEYENNAYGKIKITVENDKLIFESGDLKAALEHLCFDSFILEVEDKLLFIPLQFKINITGKITAVDIKFEPALNEMIEFSKL